MSRIGADGREPERLGRDGVSQEAPGDANGQAGIRFSVQKNASLGQEKKRKRPLAPESDFV
jgi:hypothetical protein